MHLKKIVPFRNVSIFLVLVLLILLLAGCQPGDNSGTGTTAEPQDPSRSTAGSTSDPTTEPTPEPTRSPHRQPCRSRNGCWRRILS